MSSSSPPPSGPPASTAQKRRFSSSSQTNGSLSGSGVSAKKPKTSSTTTAAPVRKSSSGPAHPLRQASFPPPESSPSSGLNIPTPRGGGGAGSTTGAPTGAGDDEDDEGRDDYGEQTVLGEGGGAGFQEDQNEKERLSMLLEAFDNEQMARYEAFRRGNLNKSAVKKLANQVLSQSVTANVGTVICGFSKVFTGEIIELAIQIQKAWGDEGPLLPDHLREAWRRYKLEMHGAVGYRGAIGGGSPVAEGGGPGVGSGIGGGVGRLFR